MDTAPATAPAAEIPATEPAAAETSAATSTTASKLAALPALVKARVAELQARAKELQARAKTLPTEARSRALAAVTKLRVALDLPSRSEIAELTQRLDALDRRISEIAGAPSVEGARPVAGLPAGVDLDAVARAATVPEGTPEPVKAEGTAPAAEAEIPEHQRKDKRRNNAAKTSRR